MAICNVDYCDFIVFTLKGLHIERISRDEHFWLQLLTNIKEVYLQFILPELLSGSIKDDSDNNDKICKCKKPVYGRVIKCGNSLCKVSFYHYGCVELRRKPRKTWYCNDCQQ